MKQKRTRPLCFDCKYFWPNRGTGNGCLKVLYRNNPFKKTFYNTSRWVRVVKELKNCKYYELKK